jgi:hypothetical protein
LLPCRYLQGGTVHGWLNVKVNPMNCPLVASDTMTKTQWFWLMGYDLVGGLEHFLFFHILGIIIPTD